MSEPIVSAVIPAYNRAGSIRAAVESVLAQSVREIEVIVVDDASTDATREVVRGIGDPRLCLIERSRNGGAAAARNTGICAARGAFIGFLDSDDLWLPGKIERQIVALRRATPDAAVSCTGVEMHLLDHGVVRTQYLEDTGDWGRRLALDCDLSPGSTLVAHRAVFERVGLFDEALPRFEDWDWLLRHTRNAGIVTVRDPLARVFNRRARLGATVESAAALFLAKHKAVMDGFPPADRRRAIANLWLQVVGTYAFEGRFATALPAVAAAARQRPLHTIARLAAGAGLVVRGRLLSRLARQRHEPAF